MLQIKKQQGFSVAMILGIIAILGVIAYIGSTLVSSVVIGNQKTNLITQSDQALIQSSYILTTEAPRNASGIPIAAPILAGTNVPSGGGLIPNASAAIKTDSFGTNFGYCVNASPSLQADPVFALISAGANKTFNTTCAQALLGTNIGDDKVIVKSVTNILQGVGGTVYFGDPVPTVASLATLTAVKPGQLRTVTADGSIYVNATGSTGAAAWAKAGAAGGSGGGSGGGGPTVMYLLGVAIGLPTTCPTSWTEADYKISNATSSSSNFYTYTRTCYNPLPYSIMYLEGTSNIRPTICPTGWTEADYKMSDGTNSSSNLNIYRRTCYIAQTVSTSAGANQSWQDVKANRLFNTEYTNTSSNPIDIKYSYTTTGSCNTYIKINIGSGYTYLNQSPTFGYVTASAIIPPNAKYMVETANTQCVLLQWHEFK